MTRAPQEDGPWLIVLNCGSSSIKYQWLDPAHDTWTLKGNISGIGTGRAVHSCRQRQADGQEQESTEVLPHDDAPNALAVIGEMFRRSRTRVDGIVHRVAHGGEHHVAPQYITPELMDEFPALEGLAPLHNPANFAGIRICLQLYPQLPQFAVFDTGFHATLPPAASTYAIPPSWRALGMRRYGFHGSSHHYVALEAARWMGRPLAELNIVTLHLGNGASVCAIRKGISVETSMGFTPLEGLVMGSRSGDIDAGLVLHAMRHLGLSVADTEQALNQASGLKAIAGTPDMRSILAQAEAGDSAAQLALEMYCHRARKYLGAYLGILGGANLVVFTGGIGENAAKVREQILSGFGFAGIELDSGANAEASGTVCQISTGNGRVPVLVIRTNEELHMARQVLPLLD